MSKADDIRRLLAQGKSRSQVAQELGVAYQQVYQVDKKRTGGTATYESRRIGTGVSAGHYRGARPYGSFSTVSVREQAVKGRDFAPIRTGPSQVRVATQDGHEVLLTSDSGGKVCNNCGLPIQFSARDDAYVHSGSGAPVTRLAIMQTGPGLFD